MKLLLAMPYTTIYPVGIAYISAALKRAGHAVDCTVFNNHEAFAKQVENGYDFVATGGLTSEYGKLKHITDIARKARTRTIVGGGIITSEPELMSQALQVDYGVIGEGEETIVELLSCLENNGAISSVQGLCYPEQGEYRRTASRKQIDNLDAMPWPDYESFGFDGRLDTLKPTDQYSYDVFDNPREYPLVASRSCPFLCTFCYHPCGNKYRQRSLDSIMEELKERVPKHRINIVGIYDELFSNNKERLYEFCRRFKEFTDTLSWPVKWGCQIRVGDLDDSQLEMMKDSGCYIVSYGFESYSPDVLKSMKKYIKPEQIHTAIHKTMDHNISIQGNFIFGDVAETMDTVMETLSFWKAHLEAGIRLVLIRAYPDSELYQYCLRKGLIKDRLRYIKNGMVDCLNMTQMTKREFNQMKTLLHLYTVKYSFYTTPLAIGPNSVTVQCPHCQETVTYNNYWGRGVFYNHIMYCRHCRKRFSSVNRWHKYYAKCTPLIVVKYKIDDALGKMKAKLITKLKSYPLVWHLYHKFKRGA